MAYLTWSRIDPVTRRFIPTLTDEERKQKRIRKRNDYNKAWYARNREGQRVRIRERHQRIKLECLAHYSQGVPKCACCGEEAIEFLSIDHIDGGGAKHRKSLRASTLWEWLRKHNFPDGFRVLCMNCNWAIGIHGYCPHERGAK